MARQHYFLKLIPPRATFPGDITPDELALMGRHAVYCREHFDAGTLVAYGPVMAPAGAFGMAIVEAESEEEARQFGEGDPSVREGLNRFEIYPMRVIGARGLS